MIDVKLVESAPPTPRSTPEASDSSEDEINVCFLQFHELNFSLCMCDYFDFTKKINIFFRMVKE